MDVNTTRPDQALRTRAARVIPAGMWGHQNASRLPASYPQFFASANGCRIRDVDGREYIDFMCGWGPMILGYGHPGVEAAADRQRRAADGMNGPCGVLVDLAELMVDTIPHADWVMFQKNGTDATTACVMIARSGGRRKILLANGAYHGAVPWCNPNPAGATAEDREHIIRYDWNDIGSLEAAALAAGTDLAGVIVSAFRHDLGKAQEMPSPAFAQAVRALCDRTEAAMIVDDVRAGFRLHMGGSWELAGVRPDLSAWSKAIANGYPLAMVSGNERFRAAASRVFVTGSFWTGAVAMAAAIETVRILKAEDGIARMQAMGERLRAGLDRQATAHGQRLRQSGPAQMPMMLFDRDEDRARGWHFCSAALTRGVYLHATHTMFLSAAHTETDIDIALDATEDAMHETAREFGRQT